MNFNKNKGKVMYKVVINNCFGGFSLSKEASNILVQRYGVDIDPDYGYLPDDIERHDKRLIEVIEELGVEIASGYCASLYIEEIESPMYRIDEYDGRESLETPRSYDWVVIKEY